MTKHFLAKLWAWSLGFALVCSLPAYAQTPKVFPNAALTTVASPSGQNEDLQTVLKQLAIADVVYLGETHDRQNDHDAQLEIIQTLWLNSQASSGKVCCAIAMEMFQRPYQSVLDRYLANKITETQLKELSQYPKRWGFPWEYYSPILRFAQEKRLPVLALNTPSEVTRKVARSGLNNLTVAERRFIPPISAIRAEPETYRQEMRQVYEEIHQGKSNSSQFDRFFLAQVLWDETMAETISQFLQKHPQTQVIVLVGQGHVAYRYGIPDRVARRVSNGKSLLQSVVLLNPPQELTTLKDQPAADYFWYRNPPKP